MENGKVTIAVSPDVKEMLKELKVHPRESFNEVIKRLISKNNEGSQEIEN